MISIDYISFGIGAGLIIVLWIVLSTIKSFRKPKYSWAKLKGIVQDAGNQTKEVYKNLQDLGNAFNQMEKDSK